MPLHPNSIPQNTRRNSQQDFADLLRQWYDHTTESVMGDSALQKRTPWLWVQVGAYRCHLNADTKRQGVRKYLELVDRYTPDMAWPVRLNQQGKNINKICFGSDAERIRGFYLYVIPALEEETTI